MPKVAVEQATQSVRDSVIKSAQHLNRSEPGWNLSEIELSEVVEAALPHVRSVLASSQSPDRAKKLARHILLNYFHDGILVDSLLGRIRSKDADKNIGEAHQFLERVVRSKTFGPMPVEDLVQSAWLRILKNLDGFHFLSRFRTWAVKILLREYLDQLRRLHAAIHGGGVEEVSLNQSIQTEEDNRTIGESLATTDPDPLLQMIFDELKKLISVHIDNFPERERAIGIQAILEGRLPREIANDLGIPANQVSRLLHVIRKHLKEDPQIGPSGE